GGEVAVPPLRDLGGWSSVNAGTATTYVRSLPLPDGDGVAVLRLRGLAEPVHVAVDGGPGRLVMPGAPVIVLEPAEGGGEGGGEVAVPPLRDLGGWSSVNAGTATTYVRSLPLPDGDGVAVLRLRGLAEPVHVAVDGGPERLVMPGAPVIVLEPAEGGGEGGGQVEVAVRAPHLPGGLLDRVELLHARAPRLLDLRTVREAELAELLTEHARTADAVGRHPLPGPSTRPARTERGETAAADPAGGSPAGLPIDAGAPVLIRLAAETGLTAPAG